MFIFHQRLVFPSACTQTHKQIKHTQLATWKMKKQETTEETKPLPLLIPCSINQETACSLTRSLCLPACLPSRLLYILCLVCSLAFAWIS
ncbi:hypothetical protein DM02DRAFT_250782 [Periconia macrospinosa]|uniref:Uncharacterized protein n=1 Tax=Periconia macrospinosa TaxID=97972 RepID=A0A2V1DZD6_9PLEO|nr:hypothetical protein DM02DRAFT_250782 [Periconia macrospinosa]